MHSNDEKYTRFALCREMLETPDIIRQFDPAAASPLTRLVRGSARICFTGEGSSRIFPAKRARIAALRRGTQLTIFTEGAAQAAEYDLSGCAVLGASNSGRTRELVRLFRFLKDSGHTRFGGITAHPDTPLEKAGRATVVLRCGPEDAVAATKSVVEQALIWQAVLAAAEGREFPDTAEGAAAFSGALQTAVPDQFASAVASARTVYFAGRNDGVAEELTLKTNEIVRKPSGFLEGTYAVHGIEEVMDRRDAVVLVNPFPEEEAKFKECLADGAGAAVLAISERDTLFPTLKISAPDEWLEYALLAAGWNLLVEAGLFAGVDMDKPERARKVGNAVY